MVYWKINYITQGDDYMKIKKILIPLLVILLMVTMVAFGTSVPLGPYFDNDYFELSSDALTLKAGSLIDIFGLAKTDGGIIVGDGTNFVLETGATARASLGLTIGTNVQAYDAALDSVSALAYVSPSLIKLTADDTYAVRTLTEVKEDLNLEIGTDVLAQQTIGIADDNLVEIDDADAANDDYAKFTANGLEGRSYTEMKTDLAYQLSDLSDVNTSTPTDKFVLVADGTDFESRALVEADISDLGTTTAMVADKLDVFAATTSAQLAGVISDEIGTGKLRFDTSVTAKTTTATLTVAEAGTILISAASAYTITLPTPVDNVGLTYKVKKTDFNYNLITMATTAGQFNYENTDSALKDTYPRLNTGGAEATFISDGTNWQVIQEALGQVPECWVYLDARQLNIMNNEWSPVELDTKEYDIGSNYNIGTWASGNATSTSSGHLVDTNASFTSAMTRKRVVNTTDSTYTYITAVNSATDVTVRDNIFVDTEGYEIKYTRFVFPVSGKYKIDISVTYYKDTVIADKDFACGIKQNGTDYIFTPHYHTSNTGYFSANGSFTMPGTKDDFIRLVCIHEGGVDTVDIAEAKANTFLVARLISKD